jgi:hypothetical protein
MHFWWKSYGLDVLEFQKKKIQMIVAFTNKGIEIHVILFIISSEID